MMNIGRGSSDSEVSKYHYILCGILPNNLQTSNHIEIEYKTFELNSKQ